ncbi:Metallo-hydrolase/oxidoreductase [Tilletiaria anomala UBC 951]|uniref:Metallo-hydrolase/oxidoreductase n=1 Tax=Tilletiaria anomala (strain ATCC 24038 / CBS 436.72 / UBC 951) TaxID=1037660 RepID=A0A066WLE1_TILAU|nr:Metallo-hydrolase/oxidoreductase [Tilletiaria anomala UBC 951]KDN53388.1 Metallo-hydrolase/oxidoreductase [Tilletiaria anomala UBC 951]
MSSREEPEPLVLKERLQATFEHQVYETPPEHHVTVATPESSWVPSMPHWAPTPEHGNPALIRTGFRNPWASAVKPNVWQIWGGLQWADTVENEPVNDRDNTRQTEGAGFPDPDLEIDVQIIEEIQSSHDNSAVRATWLGHAGTLLELPTPDGDPVRVLFDPIFSSRCSPTQYFGPMRMFPSPVTAAALPPIDFVLISHSHYDHLDLTTLAHIWELNKGHVRFLAPLGNKNWFLRSSGIDGLTASDVEDFDWWDECRVSIPSSGQVGGPAELRIICTPAQHGSGRVGIDANTTLWSSWYLSLSSEVGVFRAFFAGDTGFQFHDPSPPYSTAHSSPPAAADARSVIYSDAPRTIAKPSTSAPNATLYPCCPAFADISRKLGAPHLSLLPISVGATLSFLKSYDPFPYALHGGWSPFPSGLDERLTAANHMTPRDAVRVFDLMQKPTQPGTSTSAAQSVALAIHWGTFIADVTEAQQSLRKLRKACKEWDIDFARTLPAQQTKGNSTAKQDDSNTGKLTFVALNAGQHIEMHLRME